MPEKQTGDLIGCRLHVKHNPDAFFFLRDCLFHLKNDRRGKVFVPLIFRLIILANIDHTAQVLDQASVRIIRRRFIKESTTIGIGIQNDLQCVNDRGFTTSRMTRKKVDPIIEGQHFMAYIMPVVQAHPGQGFKSLVRHLLYLLH